MERLGDSTQNEAPPEAPNATNLFGTGTEETLPELQTKPLIRVGKKEALKRDAKYRDVFQTARQSGKSAEEATALAEDAVNEDQSLFLDEPKPSMAQKFSTFFKGKKPESLPSINTNYYEPKEPTEIETWAAAQRADMSPQEPLEKRTTLQKLQNRFFKTKKNKKPNNNGRNLTRRVVRPKIPVISPAKSYNEIKMLRHQRNTDRNAAELDVPIDYYYDIYLRVLRKVQNTTSEKIKNKYAAMSDYQKANYIRELTKLAVAKQRDANLAELERLTYSPE